MKNGPSVGQLTTEQREAYNAIKKWTNNKNGTAIMLEALPGTGKTFVLSALAKTYNTSVDYLVFRKDQASQLALNKTKAYTYVSYNMRHFHLQYINAIKMFSMFGANNIDVLYKLIKYSLRYTNITDRCTVNTIILDTYTVSSPIMLLLLYILSLRSGVNLIFSGSKLHMGAIRKSRLHDRNNFYIAEILSDLTVTKLTRNMRSRDDNFMSKLTSFCKAIECCKPEGEVQFHFGLRYMLYCLFKPKYFTEERFDTIYMSQYHHDITKRLYRFIDYLKSNNVKHIIEPYQFWNGKTYVTIPLDSNKDRKFFPGLILVKGYKYVYITKEGLHRIVRLEEMHLEGNRVHTLVIRLMDEDRVEKIQRTCLNYYQILPAYRAWLLPEFSDDWLLFHFPLRMYTLTFHAALGQTIKTETVEVSTDYSYPTSTANCVYVGLSSLPSESAIHKIHAGRDLLSFVVTNYMEIEREDEEFYYRCPEDDKNRDVILQYASTKGINEYIDKIQWITVDSILRFEGKKSTGYLRIPRTTYEQGTKKEKPTSLMKVAEFMKENPNEILSIINAVRAESSIGVSNKKKKSKMNPKESQAYICLEKAYNDWVANKKGKQ